VKFLLYLDFIKAFTMRKIVVGIGVSVLFASCGGGTSEAVNIEDVKDACDCSRAFIEVANDILDDIGDRTEGQMRKDEKLIKKMEPKFEKLDQLENKCKKELNVTLEEMFACDSRLEEVMRKFDRKF
jgi:hypothetical protein